MSKRSDRVIGALFVMIGALFLLKNLDIDILKPFFDLFDPVYLLARFWPTIFLLIPAFLFHYGFFQGRRREPGLLVPGGILLVLGVAFQINMLIGLWDVLFPLYIFSVAFGLFELYYFGNREKGLLVPVFILGGLSFILFATISLKRLLGTMASNAAIPVALIFVGLFFIFGPKRK